MVVGQGQRSVSLFVSLIFMIVTLALLTGCGGGIATPPPVEPVVSQPEDPLPDEEEPPSPQEQKITIQEIKPVTVVINNYATARPQSGLQQATFVYEFLVEGGMTRFLAVYNRPFTTDFTIGPVRSLRPFLGVKAAEHGGIIAHSGYSPRTKEMLRPLRLREITTATHLWRDSSRRAPHNLYTGIEKLRQVVGSTSTVTEREIIPAQPDAPYQSGSEITIKYSRHNIVTYTFNPEREVYLRFVDGEKHYDRETGEQHYARRVIIQKVRHTHVSGTDLIDIDLEGEGEGFLYEGGRRYDIIWEKTAGTTNYYYQDNTPIELGWGNTWIQIVWLSY